MPVLGQCPATHATSPAAHGSHAGQHITSASNAAALAASSTGHGNPAGHGSSAGQVSMPAGCPARPAAAGTQLHAADGAGHATRKTTQSSTAADQAIGTVLQHNTADAPLVGSAVGAVAGPTAGAAAKRVAIKTVLPHHSRRCVYICYQQYARPSPAYMHMSSVQWIHDSTETYLYAEGSTTYLRLGT